MDITCDIAMDLVDIYTSGAASEDTENTVKEHLKTCKNCRSFYEGYKKSLEEEGENEDKNNYIKVETSPYIADEILSESVKKLTRRLRTRRIISNTVGIISVILGIAFAVSEFLEAFKDSDK